VLAGTNSMAQHSFYFASSTAAAAWIITYGLSAYSFGGAFANLASPAVVVLGLAATLIVLATPVLILRYERSLLVKIERQFPGRSESRSTSRRTDAVIPIQYSVTPVRRMSAHRTSRQVPSA
jgi:hypothetical protein